MALIKTRRTRKRGLLKNFMRGYKVNFSSALTSIIFSGLFFTVFYGFGLTSGYIPLPAALPFLVLDETSSLPADVLLDDNVVDNTPVDGDSIVSEGPMANGMKLLELDQRIRDAGIPINGVSTFNSSDIREIRVEFKEEASEDQRARAQEIVANFDWGLTYRDIFDADKAKQDIMQKYPAEKLVALSPHLSTINYFLGQKEFKKLKAFMNNLYLQGIISQGDYMVLADILADQKIYFNPKFGQPAQENTAETPPVQTPSPEPEATQPEPQADVSSPTSAESSETVLRAFSSGQETADDSTSTIEPEVAGAATETPIEQEPPAPEPVAESAPEPALPAEAPQSEGAEPAPAPEALESPPVIEPEPEPEPEPELALPAEAPQSEGVEPAPEPSESSQ